MNELSDADENFILHAFRPNLRSHQTPECKGDDHDLQTEDTEVFSESTSEDEVHVEKSSASTNPVSSAEIFKAELQGRQRSETKCDSCYYLGSEVFFMAAS